LHVKIFLTREARGSCEDDYEWVKKATKNLIDTVISASDIDATIDLVLANAVYFKGALEHSARDTRPTI